MPADDALSHFIQRRNDATFLVLYRAHTPRLYGMAVRLTSDSSKAEDIVQECWVRAVARIDAFDRRSSLQTWLCGILVNCYRENRRTEERLVAVGHIGESSDVVELKPQAPRVDVERALSMIADGYREILVLHDIYGYTHAEIATLLDISAGTSKSQLARGRSQLRLRLRGENAPVDRLGGKNQ